MNHVPQKYRGKTIEDVIKMHQECEKLLGRKSGEIQDLKKRIEYYSDTLTVVSKVQDTLSEEYKVTREELRLAREELEEVRARGY